MHCNRIQLLVYNFIRENEKERGLEEGREREKEKKKEREEKNEVTRNEEK